MGLHRRLRHEEGPGDLGVRQSPGNEPQDLVLAGRGRPTSTAASGSAVPLADRVWQLRHQHSSYDAWGLALAKALDVPLVTHDAEVAGPSPGADV